jgi:hypothetical protein
MSSNLLGNRLNRLSITRNKSACPILCHFLNLNLMSRKRNIKQETFHALLLHCLGTLANEIVENLLKQSIIITDSK